MGIFFYKNDLRFNVATYFLAKYSLVYDYDDPNHGIHYRITYKKGDEEVERQVMTDIVGRPWATVF